MTGTALLVTGHFYEQKRRGSIHWLADELLARGWRVRFLTVGYSWISRLTGDVRLKATAEPPRKGRYEVRPNLEQIFGFTPFHPMHLRSPAANRFAAPLFRHFPTLWRAKLEDLASDCDLVVLETGLPLMFAPILRKLGRPKLVYRVNDDIRLMRFPPFLTDMEMRYAPLFDRISLASPVLAQRFAATGRTGIDPMGLDLGSFAQPHPSPFGERHQKEVVCAGTSHFDADVVERMARLRPSWRFHIIGRLRAPLRGVNIVTHGELPFHEVPRYVQHAEIGLAPYKDLPGVEYQVHHSNRLKQYAYCKLPTLAPMRMVHPDAPHVIGYDLSSDNNLELALRASEAFNRESLPSVVPTWSELCDGVLSVFSEDGWPPWRSTAAALPRSPTGAAGTLDSKES